MVKTMIWKERKFPKCNKNGCFAWDKGRCTVLYESYGKDECPFEKPFGNVTNGKIYPFDKNYEDRVNVKK